MIALETQTVAGGVTAPAGFRAAGVACGIKANGKPDLALLVSDAAGVGGGGLHDQRRAGGADPRLARPPRADRAAARQRWSSTAAAPTRAPAPTGCARARDDPRSRRGVGCAPESVLVASTGVIGVKLPMPKVAARHRPGGRGAVARRRRRCRARHHDDRSVPEGSGGGSDRRGAAPSGSAAWPRARA